MIPGPPDNTLAAAERLYPGKVGALEWHHIWPKYIGGARGGLQVSLPAEYHQLITKTFRDFVAYGSGPIPRDQAMAIMRDVYRQLTIRGFPLR